jgi:hypothetical protein
MNLEQYHAKKNQAWHKEERIKSRRKWRNHYREHMYALLNAELGTEREVYIRKGRMWLLYKFVKVKSGWMIKSITHNHRVGDVISSYDLQEILDDKN